MGSSGNMLTFDTRLKVRLSNREENNHKSKEVKFELKQEAHEKENMTSDTSLIPTKRYTFLRKEYRTKHYVSPKKGRIGKEGEERRRSRSATNHNYITNDMISIKTKGVTYQPQQLAYFSRLNSTKQHNLMLLATINSSNSHPFNTICPAAACKSVACCNSLPICKKTPTRIWHRASIICSMVFISSILATLLLLEQVLVVAGQQQLPSDHQNLYSKQQSLSNSYQAENSETVLWPSKATTSSSGQQQQQKKRAGQEEEEISKLSEQRQNKNQAQVSRQQATSYHDLDLHLDSLHSSLSQSNNLSKHQRQLEEMTTTAEEQQEKHLEQPDDAPLKRSKRSSRNHRLTEDVEQQLRELELERRRRPILMTRVSRNIRQPATRFRRLDDTDPTSADAANPVISENKQIDCTRLLNFWASFKFSYPSLAAYLLTVHLSEEAPTRSIANRFSFKAAQLIKSIARLLNEAELLARSSPTDSNNKQQNPWLSRVLTNPMYAKIVTQFTNQAHFPATNQQFSAKLQQKQQQHSRANNNKSINNRMIEINQQQQWNNSDGHVYGRVIHYPHELSPYDGSSLTKTLQKLRELSNARKFDTGGESQQDRELESNRIQTMLNGADGEPWTASNSQNSKDFPIRNYNPSDSDAARNKFVYGSILFKPNQVKGQDHNSQQRHHSSFETLRQLQQGGLPDHQTSVSASESYGTVLVSPASLSGQQLSELNSGRENQQQHRIGDSRQHSVDNIQQQQDHDGWSNKSTLDKLKQKLDISTNQFESAGNSNQQQMASLGNAWNSGDELGEQHGNSMAAHSNLDLGANSDSSNEFEGDWHSAPLQQVEIRQPRNDGSTGHVTHTTLNSRDVFVID